MLYLIFMTPL